MTRYVLGQGAYVVGPRFDVATRAVEENQGLFPGADGQDAGVPLPDLDVFKGVGQVRDLLPHCHPGLMRRWGWPL